MKELKIKLDKEKVELDRLRAEYSKLEKKLTTQYNKWKTTLERIDAKKLKSKKVDWEFLLSLNPETNVRYAARTVQLEKIGLMSSGGFANTNQVDIKICLYKYNEKRNKKTIKGLKKLLPYIKPVTKGVKRISIFEESLSIHGSYSLEIKKTTARIVKCIYGRKESITKWVKLDVALKYIKNNLWYEEN